MVLPKENHLPTNLLAACFNSTSATYKFYWLISIIQEVENGNYLISKRNLFARMISNAWFTVNYFHVSFGKQDLIQDAVRFINQIEKISVDEKQEVVFHQLSASTNSETEKILWHFNKNVPHWFLRPWFPGKDKAAIYQESKSLNGNCLYALYDQRIEINTQWSGYLKNNAKVLKDFCYWNLALFLQAKNPNVPDIPNKLIKPGIRNNLNSQRRNFWDVVLKESGSLKCIYTGKSLTIGDYAIEHFIPHNFVSHDLIWNLIPADKSFNSRKSDKLPRLEKYFESFFNLQKLAVEIVLEKTPNNKLLQDYFTIFPDLNNFTNEKFKETIQPLITIASNNGFEFLP